jgi:hypothetical protein
MHGAHLILKYLTGSHRTGSLARSPTSSSCRTEASSVSSPDPSLPVRCLVHSRWVSYREGRAPCPALTRRRDVYQHSPPCQVRHMCVCVRPADLAGRGGYIHPALPVRYAMYMPCGPHRAVADASRKRPIETAVKRPMDSPPMITGGSSLSSVPAAAPLAPPGVSLPSLSVSTSKVVAL